MPVFSFYDLLKD